MKTITEIRAETTATLDNVRNEALNLSARYPDSDFWVVCFAEDFTPMRHDTAKARIGVIGKDIYLSSKSIAETIAEHLNEEQHHTKLITLRLADWSVKRADCLTGLIDLLAAQ